jgi:IS5 family transposase
VRPIVRGKEKAKVEFGSKINVSLVDGYAFLDYLSWEPYNEGGYLIRSVEMYKQRHKYYPSR